MLQGLPNREGPVFLCLRSSIAKYYPDITSLLVTNTLIALWTIVRCHTQPSPERASSNTIDGSGGSIPVTCMAGSYCQGKCRNTECYTLGIKESRRSTSIPSPNSPRIYVSCRYSTALLTIIKCAYFLQSNVRENKICFFIHRVL